LVNSRIFSNFVAKFNKRKTFFMRKFYFLVLIVLTVCLGCQWQLKPPVTGKQKVLMEVERYDKIETHFLQTGDYSVMQQMNTDYPVQTRTLIENVLRLGQVDESNIKGKFYGFYQDSTLQYLLADVESQFVDMRDINKDLSEAFSRLRQFLPTLPLPCVYSQVSALDQSIIIGDGYLGISLDKYLGANYPLYIKFGYSEKQRMMMTRDYIVPDCISFYLLSLYHGDQAHVQMPKIQYVVNRVMGRRVFDSDAVVAVEKFMVLHPNVSVEALLKDTTPMI